MSADGYVSTWVVQGSVDTAEFFDFIIGDVVRISLRFAVIVCLTIYYIYLQ